MATYKVLQDIEAEDKLVGPLTLRQCIYAAVAILAGYLSFLAATKGAAFLIFFFLPFIGFGLFFAFPWSKQQSTEVWALAKVRFMLKPRRRIWDQSGVKDLVTVTVPKQVEDPRLHQLSETEVRSRLRALADTIDSRGWAIKNVPLDMYVSPSSTGRPTSDRLIAGVNVPNEVADYKTTEEDDMFDLANNPLARQFDQKMTAASSAYRQELIEKMTHPVETIETVPAASTAPTEAGNFWYGAQPPAPPAAAAPDPVATAIPVAATPTPEEEALALEIKRKQELLNNGPASSYGHLHTIQPLSVQSQQAAAQAQTQAQYQAAQPINTAPQIPQQPVAAPAAAPQQIPIPQPAMPAVSAVPNPAPQAPVQAVTPPVNPAILELANNNDLDIATIAREAHHRNHDDTNEVVVTLH